MTTTTAPATTTITDRLACNAATALDLTSQLKEAHWVVTGPNFIALHELFDAQAALMRGHVDAFAERVRQLGGTPRGTIRQAARQTELDDFPAEVRGGTEVVQTLVDRYDTFAEIVKRSAEEASDSGDVASEDLCIEVLRSLNLQRWFLQSHLDGNAR